MGHSTIPVDLLNPGQVFASLGLLEAAEVLLGDAVGGFEEGKGTARRFTLSAASEADPIKAVLEFIRDADVCSLSPDEAIKERDGWPREVTPGVHPCKLKGEARTKGDAMLPIRLTLNGQMLQVDYWCDTDSGRPVLQLWSASYKNSAAVRFGKLHDAFKQALIQRADPERDPMNLSAPVTANYRLEMRRNWTPSGIGFSPDKLKSACPMDIPTFPCVELLAAIGLTHARPRPWKDDPLRWTYSAWMPLPPGLARAALGGSLSLHERGRFRMILEQANKTDKSIIQAFEETDL